MNLKKFKKLSIVLFFGFIPFVASSCAPVATDASINSLSLWKNYNTLSSYISDENSDALEWIAQRTFSVRLQLSPTDGGSSVYEFGTAWIFAKDESNQNTYYLATNIHVISNLNELSSSTVSYTMSTDNKIEKEENYRLVDFAVNFISDSQIASVRKNDDGSINYLSTYSDFSNYITIKGANNSAYQPEIVYTATGDNLVDNSQSLYVNPYTKTQILNPAIDFAIIKVDFSNVLDKTNSQSTTISEFLNNYDANPTQFSATADLNYDDSFYIAGFPEEETSWKPNKSVAWLGLTNIKLTPENSYIALAYDNTSKYIDLTDPTSIKPASGAISYISQENDETYLWYRDVANQLIIGGGSIGGGASGSMVVEQTADNQFKVIGIYWGEYAFTTNLGISYNYATVDLLKSNSYTYTTYDKGITVNYNYPSYDVISEVENELDITLPTI